MVMFSTSSLSSLLSFLAVDLSPDSLRQEWMRPRSTFFCFFSLRLGKEMNRETGERRKQSE